MWLFTTQGFYSVVEDRDDPQWLLVRTRTREDLTALGSQVEGLEVFENADADYRWRARLLREEWLAAVAQLAHAIDYPNFKEAVDERQGSRRASLYSKVWLVLRRLGRP